MAGERAKILLVSADDDAGAKAASLVAAGGWTVAAGRLGRELLGRLRSEPPDAVVLDLDRRPSEGRDLGLHLRKTRATRGVRLVFAGGGEAARRRVIDLLPDVEACPWERAAEALGRALASAATDPVVPDSVFAPYAGRPLAAKLGIREHQTVLLVGAPEGFEETLGELPPGVTVTRTGAERPGTTVWFVRTPAELEGGLAGRAGRLGDGGLWIAWPKGGSAKRGELTQAEVRRAGLAAGLVDHKICAVDATWSGLRFVRRRR